MSDDETHGEDNPFPPEYRADYPDISFEDVKWNEVVTGIYAQPTVLANGTDPGEDGYEEIPALSIEIVTNNDHFNARKFTIPVPLLTGIMIESAKVMSMALPQITREVLQLSDDDIELFIDRAEEKGEGR